MKKQVAENKTDKSAKPTPGQNSAAKPNEKTDTTKQQKNPTGKKEETKTISGKTPSGNSKVLKNAKGQPIVIEEEVKPPPEKEKVLERFIYVTTYNDYEVMKTLKDLFESINKEAFALRSVKEVYTRILTPEEQDDNNIDYISGFQIIDSVMRITIIEGIGQKAMKLVKERLPKLTMNSQFKKIFSNSKILFNARIYSKFNLSLKFLKLRDSLNNIFTTFDIYLKANKYREIFNAFQNIGSILNSDSLEMITQGNLFPPAESLLLLERKYADILTDEDMTGIHTEKKIKGKKRLLESLEKLNVSSSVKTTESNVNVLSKQENKSTAQDNIIKNVSTSLNNSPILLSIEKKPTGSIEPSSMTLKGKLDSHNYEYFKHKESMLFKQVDYFKKNINYLTTMKKKNPGPHFCTRLKLNDTNKPSCSMDNDFPYLYSQQSKNCYVKFLNLHRDRYIKDKDHFYTYSKDYLTLSFPLIPNTNMQYDAYMENKRKWISKDDFERYKQPGKEFTYIPKIINEL